MSRARRLLVAWIAVCAVAGSAAAGLAGGGARSTRVATSERDVHDESRKSSTTRKPATESTTGGGGVTTTTTSAGQPGGSSASQDSASSSGTTSDSSSPGTGDPDGGSPSSTVVPDPPANPDPWALPAGACPFVRPTPVSAVEDEGVYAVNADSSGLVRLVEIGMQSWISPSGLGAASTAIGSERVVFATWIAQGPGG